MCWLIFLYGVFLLDRAYGQDNPGGAIVPNVGSEYNDRGQDGSFRFGFQTGDEGGHYHAAVGSKDNQVAGRFGAREPTGRLVETQYTAGQRGFRARGPNIARRQDLSQVKIPYNPPVDPSSPNYKPSYDTYFDPNEDPSYDFEVRSDTYNRKETADSRGRVDGIYSFVDDVGETHNVRYEAGARIGFNVKSPFPDSEPFTGLFYNGPASRPGGGPRGKTSIQQAGDGSYRFVAAGPDQRRTEVSDALGNVRGSYTYIDDKGQQRTVEYIAGPNIGYKVLNKGIGPNFPSIPPFVPTQNLFPNQPTKYDELNPNNFVPGRPGSAAASSPSSTSFGGSGGFGGSSGNKRPGGSGSGFGSENFFGDSGSNRPGGSFGGSDSFGSDGQYGGQGSSRPGSGSNNPFGGQRPGGSGGSFGGSGQRPGGSNFGGSRPGSSDGPFGSSRPGSSEGPFGSSRPGSSDGSFGGSGQRPGSSDGPFGGSSQRPGSSGGGFGSSGSQRPDGQFGGSGSSRPGGSSEGPFGESANKRPGSKPTQRPTSTPFHETDTPFGPGPTSPTVAGSSSEFSGESDPFSPEGSAGTPGFQGEGPSSQSPPTGSSPGQGGFQGYPSGRPQGAGLGRPSVIPPDIQEGNCCDDDDVFTTPSSGPPSPSPTPGPSKPSYGGNSGFGGDLFPPLSAFPEDDPSPRPTKRPRPTPPPLEDPDDDFLNTPFSDLPPKYPKNFNKKTSSDGPNSVKDDNAFLSSDKNFLGFPPGVSVRGHVQSLDILPYGSRIPPPGLALESQLPYEKR